MGEWTDKFFDGIELGREKKNLGRRAEIVKGELALEGQKRQFVERTAEAYRAALEDTKGKSEEQIKELLTSLMDSCRVGDSAAGASVAAGEDSRRTMLRRERAGREMAFPSLKTAAVSATARLLGIARRGVGYDSPATGARSAVIGPLILTLAVGLFEVFPTANWFNNRLALWMSSLGGGMRVVLPWVAATVLTGVVMAITFMAGRKLKQGVVARRAINAEDAGSGQGGELGAGIALVVIAGLMQMVTLGLRFSTNSGDPAAQAGFMVLGFISLIGAAAVVVFEYSAYSPSAGEGTVVYTRPADAATVEAFRFSEYRLKVGIESDKLDHEVGDLRRVEAELEKMQSAARDISDTHVTILNEVLADIRGGIRERYARSEAFDPTDLETLARATYPAPVSQPLRFRSGPEAA